MQGKAALILTLSVAWCIAVAFVAMRIHTNSNADEIATEVATFDPFGLVWSCDSPCQVQLLQQNVHQQTTMLEKVVWHPLRPEHRDFFPDSLWLYAGPETYLYGHGQEIGDLKSVIRKGHYEVDLLNEEICMAVPVLIC